VASSARVEDFDHPTARQLVAFTATIVGLGVLLPFEPVAALAVLLGAAIFVWRWRRESGMKSVVLEVEGGRLALLRPGLGASVSLSELRAVVLSDEPTPAFAIVGHGVREGKLSTDGGRSRIVLRTSTSATPLLPIAISQTECLEWIPKIRAFLREEGWSPPETAPEVEAGEDDADDDDD